MSFRFFVTAACVLACSAPANAQAGPNSTLEEALSRTRAMAFRSEHVDWPALEARVRAAAAGAGDIVDLLPALEVLVEGLGDGHSFVNASVEDRAAYVARHGSEFDALRPYRKSTSAFRSRREPEERPLALVSGHMAHFVTVPQKMGGGAAGTAYVNALYAKVTTGARSCGYVVDLRGNQGGNVWLMVAGLAPLLGEGWRSHELNRDGSITSAGYLKGGAAIAGEGEYAGQTIVAVDGWRALTKLAQTPVAVLIDDAVGSSGEGVAVAFKGRPRTRFFGETTYGAASSNEGFMLSDRVNLVITSGMMADRNGGIYPDGVPPDQVVAPGPGAADDPDDAVVEAAKAWLARQKACRKS